MLVFIYQIGAAEQINPNVRPTFARNVTILRKIRLARQRAYI